MILSLAVATAEVPWVKYIGGGGGLPNRGKWGETCRQGLVGIAFKLPSKPMRCSSQRRSLKADPMRLPLAGEEGHQFAHLAVFHFELLVRNQRAKKASGCMHVGESRLESRA